MSADTLSPVSLAPPAKIDKRGSTSPAQQVGTESKGRPVDLQGEEESRPTASQASAEESAKPGAEQAQESIRERIERVQAEDLLRQVKFQFDVEDGRILVKVVDAETDKVIRMVPPEEQQELARRLDEYQGIVFDRKA